MGVVVLIVLAAVWAAFLVPPYLRNRSEHRPAGSISDFRRQLHVLARTSPAAQYGHAVGGPAAGRVVPMRTVPSTARPIGARHPLAAPSSRGAVRLGRSRQSVKRRRDIFVGLLVAMAGSLVLGLLPPLRILWTIHVVLDVLFVAYVAALIYLRNLAAEREMKIRFLPSAPQSEPALLLRRTN